MSNLTVQLPDEQMRILKERAGQVRMTPEELASIGLEDWLSRPASDFEESAARVLDKNAELYRRLA